MGAVPTATVSPAQARGRIDAFDGLRGTACLLVVLLHLWTIVPTDYLDEHGAFPGPLLGLFTAGNLAVDLFLILGGYLVTSSLLSYRATTGTAGLTRFWARRLVRLGAQLGLLVTVVIAAEPFDRWSPWSTEQTFRTLGGIVTFTFNWVLVEDATRTRDDLGHLWYLSVEQQFYVVWTVVLACCWRARWLLVCLLAGATTALFVTRFAAVDENAVAAGVRTSTRSAGLLLGALAALVAPRVRRQRRVAAHLVGPLALCLTMVILFTPAFSPYAFLETQGIVFGLAATALVVSIDVAADSAGSVQRLLSARLLVGLGRVSFPLYLWHYPVFWASSRWASDIDWRPRAIGAVVVLAAIVTATYLGLERPLARWLGRRHPVQRSGPLAVAR